jgi:hypothetical protein
VCSIDEIERLEIADGIWFCFYFIPQSSSLDFVVDF